MGAEEWGDMMDAVADSLRGKKAGWKFCCCCSCLLPGGENEAMLEIVVVRLVLPVDCFRGELQKYIGVFPIIAPPPPPPA